MEQYLANESISWLTNRSARIGPKFDQATGDGILYHGKLMKGIGVFCLLSLSLMIYGLVFALLHWSRPDLRGLALFSLLIPIFGWAAYQGIVEAYKARVFIGRQGIRAESPLPWYPITMQWDQIKRVTYSSFFSSLVFRDRQNRVIRISFLYYGIGYLASELKLRVDPSAYSKCRAFIDEIAKRSPIKA